MSAAAIGLALFVGLLISATLHFVVLWPDAEPAEPTTEPEAAPERQPDIDASGE